MRWDYIYCQCHWQARTNHCIPIRGEICITSIENRKDFINWLNQLKIFLTGINIEINKQDHNRNINKLVWYFSQRVSKSKTKQIRILTPTVPKDEPQTAAFYSINLFAHSLQYFLESFGFMFVNVIFKFVGSFNTSCLQ